MKLYTFETNEGWVSFYAYTFAQARANVQASRISNAFCEGRPVDRSKGEVVSSSEARS